MRNRVALVLLAVVAAGCSDSSTAFRTEPPPASVAPAAASPVPPKRAAPPPRRIPSGKPLTIAVGGPPGQLRLYRLLGGARTAARERDLEAPLPTAVVADVSVSSGIAPITCATWVLNPERREKGDDYDSRLLCYPAGSSSGIVMAAAGANAVNVSVRADGKALAWSNHAPEANGTVSTATFAGEQLADVRRYLADPKKPAGSGTDQSFTGAGVDAISWSGTAALTISIGVQSDDGSRLVRMPLTPDSAKRGWLAMSAVQVPQADRQKGYFTYDSVTSANRLTAYAVERAQGLGEGPQPPDRAVQVDLATGRILDVIATAAEGRYMASVTGSTTVLYATGAEKQDLTVYVRYPGERAGSPVAGLPPGVRVVYAAP